MWKVPSKNIDVSLSCGSPKHQKPSDVPLWDIEYHPYMSHRSSVLQIVIFRYHLIQGEISTFLIFRTIFKSPIWHIDLLIYNIICPIKNILIWNTAFSRWYLGHICPVIENIWLISKKIICYIYFIFEIQNFKDEIQIFISHKKGFNPIGRPLHKF